MNKIIATLMMGLLFAFSVVGVSAQKHHKHHGKRHHYKKHHHHHYHKK